MRYLKVISMVVLLSVSSIVYAENDYWERLQKRADELYGGLDVTVQVKTGYQVNSGLTSLDELEVKSGPFGKVELSVPLYSRNERRSKAKEKIDFLKEGSAYIKTIAEGQDAISILREKAKVLKAVMRDEGVSSITAYYDVLQKIALKEAEIQEAKRNFEAMLAK